MAVFGFINTTCETQELHVDSRLRSRYYKTSYIKVKEAILAYANTSRLTVKTVDDEHREIFLEGNRYHIIISIVQVNPIETSVDCKVQHYGFIGLYRPRKSIFKLYDYLNNNLSFKGVSLHP